MKLIHENPYRIAGILSNATERELQRQQSKIKKFAKIGREADSELDFNFLNPVSRSEENVNKAFSNIEQNGDKVSNSLFWFIKSNPFDETALNYLINGDKEKALEIWEKVTNGKEITAKNFSCFNNIGTLKLLGSNQSEIADGISLKFKLLDSDSFADFVHSVADQTYSIDNKKQAEKLVDTLLSQLNGKYTLASTAKLFSGCNSETKKYISKKFTEKPIHNLEARIESAKSRRKQDKFKAYDFGLKLFVDSKEDLASIKSMLGASDLKFKMIADNLAKEIMQCGIDYFQAWKDSKDPSNEGLKLLKYADSIAIGSQTKDRIRENIEGMEEWAQSAPIKEDLEYITNKLSNFQNQSDTISNAKSLVSGCKYKLQSIRGVLGSDDELYLGISSAVVGNALGMLIEVVNEAQSGLEYNRSKLLLLPGVVSDAVEVINMLDALDMNYETRRRFNDNKSTIKGMNTQLETVRRQMRSASSSSYSSSSSSSSSSGGCYIATMAYGDYDHPQVLELRKFRDEFLDKFYLGKQFIKFYYKYSPKLVEKLENKQSINNVIRRSLDQFVKLIKKKK
ncbi:MAG: hypothetical protein KDE33_15405 [Bacteroidetes bacterium]|nr:hypothetical protein [Bacteroidota bacterium]